MKKEKRKVTFIPNEGSPLKVMRQKRNELCHCGSGKKAKKCCGANPDYFVTGSAIKHRRNAVKDVRENENLM